MDGLDSTPNFQNVCKTKEDFRVRVNFLTKFYNKLDWIGADNEQGNQQYQPVQRIMRAYAYYMGEQENWRNNAITVNTPINVLNSSENQIFLMVNNLRADIEKLVSKMSVQTDLLSPDSKSEEEATFKRILTAWRNKDFQKILQQTFNTVYDPLPDDLEIEHEQDIQEYRDTSYRNIGRDVAEKICTAYLTVNDTRSIYSQCVRDLIIAGITMIDHETVNGLVVPECVMPQEIIWDNRRPNNYNKYARFRGRFMYNISPDTILQRWGDQLPQEAIDEIKQLSLNAVTNDFLRLYPISPTGNYMLYNLGTENNINSYSVVKMQFLNKCDDGYDTLHEATVIGGKWVVNERISYNKVIDMWGQEEWSMQMLISDMVINKAKSHVERMIDLQEDLNLGKFMQRLNIFFDRGRNAIYNGVKIGTDSLTLIEENFKQFRGHIAAQGSEVGENDFREPFAESVDFSLNPNIMTAYQNYINDAKNTMREIMSMPTISMGLQDTVIGKGVQQNTVNLSTKALLPFNNSFANFIQKDMQYATNAQAIAFMANDNPYVRFILGDEGYEWLMTTGRKRMEYFGIYLYPQDVITDEQRAKLDDEMFALLQRGSLDDYDWIKLKSMTSYRQMQTYLAAAMKRSRRRKAQEAELMAKREQENIALANQGIQQKQAITNEGNANVAMIKADATKESAAIQADAKDHKTNTDLITGLQKTEQKVA